MAKRVAQKWAGLSKVAFAAAMVALLVGCGKGDPVPKDQVGENIKPIGKVAVDTPPAPAKVEEPKAEAPVVAEAKPEAAPAKVEEAAKTEEPAKVAEVAPEAAAASAAGADGEKVYRTSCFACHDSGAANAPKLGDKKAWGPRIAKGMDALMESALNGVPGTSMLPRGTCATCSDDDLKASIEFMVSKAQ